MTAPGSEKRGVGARKMFAFALDSDGYITSTAITTAYTGVEVVGFQNLAITDPEPRRITHLGDDRVIDTDVLPPQGAISGTFSISGTDDDLEAAASPILARTDTEVRMMLVGTNRRGDENQLGVHIWRQALDANGVRCWESYLFPAAILTSIAGGFDDTPQSQAYSLTPQFSAKHLWGEALTVTTDGATRAQAVRMITRYKPKLEMHVGDATAVAFTLAETAVTTAAIDVFVDGVKSTALTKATDAVTFTTAPTTGAIVIVRYQYE